MRKSSARSLAAAAALSVALTQTAFSAGADSNTAVTAPVTSAVSKDGYTTDDETTSQQDFQKGDVNDDGRINVTDVVKTAAHVKSLRPLSGKALAAADVNSDGRISITDVSILAAHVKGIRALDWLEKLETVPDEEIVADTPAYSRLNDLITPRRDFTVSWQAPESSLYYEITLTCGGREQIISAGRRTTDLTIQATLLGGADSAAVKIKPYKYYNTPTRQGVKSYLAGYECGVLIKPADIRGSLSIEHTRPRTAVLSWSAADDADLYQVYCTVDGRETLCAETEAADCTVEVLPDKDHSFRVTAVNRISRGSETISLTSDNSVVGSLHTLPYYELAADVLDSVGWDLRAAFSWCSSQITYEQMNQDGSWGMEGYADYGFTNLTGNCYVMAATFCEMAKMLGYDAHQIAGFVLNANNENPHDHSWVEIDNFKGSGITFLFDPDLTNETGANGFAIQYRAPGSYNYDINHLFGTARMN